MSVIDLINNSKSTAFSFEILPPLKGNSIQKVYNVIDKLREFDPKYINITSHHSENIYKTQADGTIKKVNIRKRPGSVAIAAAIQNKYGIPAVPHIICKGFTKDETEYALIDLNFLESTTCCCFVETSRRWMPSKNQSNITNMRRSCKSK